MFLKSLELQGFKSFADKTVLDFTGDITAIVGPNGSGKSNISDAIKWVLGEQSTKTLRGNKMEDVIFGGTQTRPAKGYAEASLILDNSDSALPIEAAEVMVTRRYFRSGESEYYINRQQVRLKDVNGLFMDTGIGREGYSNIGQGKIDEILSLKSTERRSVFEEASGISAFRYRKEETEKKLEATEGNLLRIGDKISELELQLEPLKEQAEKAQKYLLLRDEIRTAEITLWSMELDKIASEKVKYSSDYNSCVFILEQERENLDGLYRTVDELSIRVREYDEQLEKERSEVEQLNDRLHVLENEKTALINTRENKTAAIRQLTDELTSDGLRTDGLKKKIQGYCDRIKEIRVLIDNKDADRIELKNKLSELGKDGTSYTEEYEKINSNISDAKVKRSTDEQELTSIGELVEECSSRCQQLNEEQTLALGRKQELESSITALQNSSSEEKDEISFALNSIKGYDLRISAKTEKAEKLENSLNDVKERLSQAAARLHALIELRDNYEGFSNAVKTVMQQAEHNVLTHIHGPVSTVLRTEKEYELAIETALSGAGQYIIVDTEQDGEKVIRYLKAKNAGRVTCLPLSVIRGNPLKVNGLDKAQGFVGLASSLVSFSKEYEPIISNILGRTVIASDLSSALKIASAYHHAFKIVTLDGQVLNAGGSMTGGSAAVKTGALSRANEIDELTVVSNTLRRDVKQYAEELAALQKNIGADRFERTNAENLLREHKEKLIRIEAELKAAETLQQSIDNSIAGIKRDISDNVTKKESLTKRKFVLENEISELKELVRTLFIDQDTASKKVLDATEAEKKLNSLILEKSGEISALQSELGTSEDTLKQFLELVNQLSDEQKNKEELLAGYQNELAGLENKIQEQAALISAQMVQIKDKKLNVEITLKTRNDLDEKKVQASGGIRTKNDEVLSLEREKARLASKLGVIEQNEKLFLDKLWDSYGLTRSVAMEQARSNESYSQLQKKTADLRRKITGLGTPNIGAIEEFNRVNERYCYLTGQRDDVENAKEELQKILQNIVAEMTSIFVSEFEKISRYFGETFIEMFGGGHAELFLEDESKPLECGIEIRVQPPGKQLKTITLLSGGEKAFVAIALYFAILKVRPSPFCMLDEIDAALDDRNVDRFAAYLDTLSNQTQFIVITHRRGTMEAADMLYGVTMQERGVSKMLRLNLEDVAIQLGIKE